MKNTFNLSDFLPYKLSILSQTISQLIAQEYESRFGLTMNQWRCMVVIGEHGSISAKGICQQTLLDKMTVSRAIKSLKVRGLVTTSNTPDDARINLLGLSKHGEKIYKDVLPIARNYEKTLLSALTDSQRRNLNDITEKLIHAARKIRAGNS